MRYKNKAPIESALKKISIFCSATIILVSLSVLFGWSFGIEFLKSIFSNFSSMRPNTALAFILSGIALLLEQNNAENKLLANIAGIFIGSIIVLIGFVACIEYFYNSGYAFNNILYPMFPSIILKLSPFTAIGFLMVGMALILIKIKHTVVTAQFLALTAGLIGIFYFINIIYFDASQYNLKVYSYMAVHTALNFILFMVAFFCLRPIQGLSALLFSPTIGGRLLRLLLPSIIIVQLVVFVLRMTSQKYGWYDFETSIMFFNMAVSLFFIMYIFYVANNLISAEIKEAHYQKHVALLLEEIEDLYNFAPCAYHSLDQDFNFTRINQTELNWLGYKREEVLKKLRFTDIMSPDSRTKFYKIITKLSDGENVDNAELELVKKDGTNILVLINARLIRDENHRFKLTRYSMFDITERSKTISALRESEQRFLKTMEFAPIGLTLVSLEGQFIQVNNTLCDMIGYTREELEKLNFQSITHPDDLEKDLNYLEQLRKGIIRFYHMEKRYVKKDGSILWVELTVSMLTDKAGSPIYFISQIEDISKRKESERDLKQAMDNLARSNEELERFAYIASHDLQEPLRMISSYLQLLHGRYASSLDQNANDFINYAVDGAVRMQNLINDLLEYSRVNRKNKEFVLANMNTLVENVLDDLKIAIQQSQARIFYENLPTVKIDDIQIRQLLQNLINNAIKFCHTKPVIQIDAKIKDDFWEFTVTDNGIGIPEEQRDKLFIPFSRLVGRNKYPGSGMGLAICKRIVERHGGIIGVRSSPDKGSIFYFTLPR